MNNNFNWLALALATGIVAIQNALLAVMIVFGFWTPWAFFFSFSVVMFCIAFFMWLKGRK